MLPDYFLWCVGALAYKVSDQSDQEHYDHCTHEAEGDHGGQAHAWTIVK